MNAKKGYIADEPQEVAGELASDTDRRLDVAAASPFEATSIGLHATLAVRHDASARMDLQIQVDVADLLLLQQGARYCGEVSLEAISYRSDGRKQMISAPTGVALTLSKQERDAALKTGLRIDRTVDLADGMQKIRLIVLDRRSLAPGIVGHTHL